MSDFLKLPIAITPRDFVVLDACVLMSTIVRRLLLRLAQGGRFQPVWSHRIGQEWVRNAARLWRVTPEALDLEWQAMNADFPLADPGDSSSYETGLRYSDANDWHVIAAGLASRARTEDKYSPRVTVLTWNLKDFNRSELRRLRLDVRTPDRLLAEWWQADPEPIIAALSGVAQDVAAVGREAEDLPLTLHRERLYRLNALRAKTIAAGSVIVLAGGKAGGV